MAPLGNSLLRDNPALMHPSMHPPTSQPAVDEELTDGMEHELERDIAFMVPLRSPLWRQILFWILGILSGGLIWLVCLWNQAFRTRLLMSPAAIHAAEYVQVQLHDKRSAVCKVHNLPSSTLRALPIRYFVFHTIRFIYSHKRQVFEAVSGVPAAFSLEMCTARRAVGSGNTPTSPLQTVRVKRELQYGENLLTVEIPRFLRIFAHDALQPFCVFQYMSVIIWSAEKYYTYAVIVFVITMTSVITNSLSQYQERKRMAELAHYICQVEVVHQDKGKAGGLATGPNGYPLVDSSRVLPGDVVVVSAGKMPYDAVLLEGEAVVDETVLTGESVPVRKAAYDIDLDGPVYHTDTFNHCTIFNGTVVSAVRGGRGGRPALAIVVATGFNTAKGRLLRTIMFPRVHNLQFVREAMYFIGMMFIMAVAFFLWDVVALVRFGVAAGVIVLKAFDMITTAVPPALPCCLAIATTISVMRLKSHDVYVLDNERVGLAGLLDAICFDKTGTLTEAGLEFGGVVPVRNLKFEAAVSDQAAVSTDIQQLFAACHGLTQLGSTVVGDPLDQRLFEVSGFDMRFEDELPPALAQPKATGGSASTSASTGPYLVLRRSARQQLPASYTPAGFSAAPPGSIQMGLLPSHAHERSDGPPQSIGHGPGVLAALGGLAKLSRSSHDPHEHVVSAAEHGHPSQIDPHHKPIALASSKFNPQDTIFVLRRFDFSSERLRSSAVLLLPSGQVVAVTKGSPEKLITLMDPASVPTDFTQQLQTYTNQGLRVIAIASREVTGLQHPSEVMAMSQDQLEAGTRLMGLVLMVNKLKPESAPAIEHLHRACIRTAMVTGDHVRTAVTVARQCAIMNKLAPALLIDVKKGHLNDSDFVFDVIPGESGRMPTSLASDPPAANGHTPPSSNGLGPTAGSQEAIQSMPDVMVVSQAQALRAAAGGEVQVAVTGRAWEKLNLDPEFYPELLELVLQRGTVFARMNPEDKRSLIEQLGFGEVDAKGVLRPGCGYYTGYCGDGANDLGALKGALVGVSLCDAEASIAAPMTSRVPHVGVMISVVAEGRCSMVTSIIIFKYTMVYAYIQVLALALLYNEGLTVGNYQYLIQDLFHTTLLASVMALTAPATSLGRERPLARVLSVGVVLPVVAQMLLDTIIQLVALNGMRNQSWYTPFDASVNEPINIEISQTRIENSVLYIMVSWQLIINALVFNVGKPFRKGLWTNPWLSASLLGLIIFNMYVLFAPSDKFKANVVAVIDMPPRFKTYLFALIIVNLSSAYLVDWGSKWLYFKGKMHIDMKRQQGAASQRRLRAAAQGRGPQQPALELTAQHQQRSLLGATPHRSARVDSSAKA